MSDTARNGLLGALALALLVAVRRPAARALTRATGTWIGQP